MHNSGAELSKRLNNSNGVEACFVSSLRWTNTICAQHKTKPTKPQNSAISMKKNLKLAAIQSSAAKEPKAKERVKDKGINFFINITLPPIFRF
ncbi:MAG TPA: hypothetical protein VNZ45_06670 [Bacteroidia bacterium]|jgi:hypothetical protein|nr:hypothetical protein [Bacteroidia bacterium]